MNDKQDKQFYIKFGAVVLVLVLFFALHMGTVAIQNPAMNVIQVAGEGLTHLLTHPFSLQFGAPTLTYLFGSAAISILIFVVLYNDTVRNRHYKTGAESGTAHFEDDLKTYNKKFTEPFDSPKNDGENNMILSQNVYLSLNQQKTLRNNNVLVVGGSGSGKSRFFVKPNILQANCNYIVTDPAGELLTATGGFLESQGYEIRVFNLVEMAKSNQYNPFNYIRDDLGVLMMINCLIKNTNPDGKTGGDPFWEKSETALLQALCFYLIKYCPKHQQNFSSVMKLLRAAEVDENNASYKSKLDRMFDEVAIKDPHSIALKQYLTFKMGAGKTLKSILISCSVRLTVFNMKQIENLTKVDTIDLGTMGEGKKALFVIIPAADSTFNFLVSMMYSQLFETLYFMGDTKYKFQCPTPVRFLLDEFANIGQIPEFTKKLATMRKYDISCSVILQNLAQIKTMYKDDWESIVGNCDSFLFLGGQEYSTLEYISKELGKTTITVRSRGMSRGKSSSSSLNFNQTARDLMAPDEIMKMPKDTCIILINGLTPFKDKKFDYPKHKNYHLTGDADKSLRYINAKDNSVITAPDQVIEKCEQRKVAEEIKDKLYKRTEEGLEAPPIPAATAFAGYNGSAKIRNPEDVEESTRTPAGYPSVPNLSYLDDVEIPKPQRKRVYGYDPRTIASGHPKPIVFPSDDEKNVDTTPVVETNFKPSASNNEKPSKPENENTNDKQETKKDFSKPQNVKKEQPKNYSKPQENKAETKVSDKKANEAKKQAGGEGSSSNAEVWDFTDFTS